LLTQQEYHTKATHAEDLLSLYYYANEDETIVAILIVVNVTFNKVDSEIRRSLSISWPLVYTNFINHRAPDTLMNSACSR